MSGLIVKQAGIALLAASAVLCGTALVRIGRKAVRRRKAAGDRAETPPQAVREQSAAVADGIRKYAAEFDGLYESAYQAARDRRTLSTEAYEEWCGRAAQLGDAAFAGAFGSLFALTDIEDEARCRERYDLLLECVDRAGIRRDRECGQTCQADDGMRRAYAAADGKPPRNDAVYTVLKPAWTCGDKVIEHGIAVPAQAGPYSAEEGTR